MLPWRRRALEEVLQVASYEHDGEPVPDLSKVPSLGKSRDLKHKGRRREIMCMHRVLLAHCPLLFQPLFVVLSRLHMLESKVSTAVPTMVNVGGDECSNNTAGHNDGDDGCGGPHDGMTPLITGTTAHWGT